MVTSKRFLGAALLATPLLATVVTMLSTAAAAPPAPGEGKANRLVREMRARPTAWSGR